jgi:hypothetical protein
MQRSEIDGPSNVVRILPLGGEVLENKMEFFLIRIKGGKQEGMFVGENVAGRLLVHGAKYSLFDQQSAAFRFLFHAALPVQRRLQNLGFETELVSATDEEKRNPNKVGTERREKRKKSTREKAAEIKLKRLSVK